MFVLVGSCAALEASVNDIILSLNAKMLGGLASAASVSSTRCMHNLPMNKKLQILSR